MDQDDRDEEGPEARAERRALKKRDKLREDAHRPLDSWERYRALTDVLDDAMELVDLADHKARFAIVIMAALNVAIFFVATRTDLTGRLPMRWQPFLALYFLAYVLLALYFFLQAIESLRPRKNQPRVRYFGEAGLEEHPLGLRFYEDILSRDLEAYRRAWREIRIGQLNNEVAVQAHALAEINRAKYRALGRLYVGLQVMTLMGVGLVGVAALVTIAVPTIATDGQPAFGSGHRVATPGVAEPSGIAFHPTLERWFLVGDEGSLAEMDADGHVTRVDPVRGNLEGIAVHGPSGALLLLAEKSSELVVWDPVARRELRRIPLDRDGLLGRSPGDANNGFEGVAFREQDGGGVLYLVHQRAPALVVTASFDLAHVETLGAASVTARWPLAGRGDLTDITWAPELARLLVLADKKDRLLVLGPEGQVQGDLKLPGRQQEGLSLGPDGSLWLADDQDKAVLKIDGALPVLERVVNPGPPPTPRSTPAPLVG